MSLEQQLARLRLAIEKMDDAVPFGAPASTLYRSEVAHYLQESCGTAPRDLIDWYCWVDRELPAQYKARARRVPFHMWVPVPMSSGLFEPVASALDPGNWSVDLFDGQELKRMISAAIYTGSDQVAITTTYLPDGPTLIADSLAAYLDNWSEVLEHVSWDSGDEYWGFQGDLDSAQIESLIAKVGF